MQVHRNTNKEESLRRIVLIATAVGLLVAAASAYAAINTYTASLGFTSKKAGSASRPVPVGFTQSIKASGTSGNRTAVLLDYKTKIYGLTVDGKDFPTCSLATIAAAKNDNKCPKGAKVATGNITAVLGNQTNFTTAGTPCDPDLDVWNSGQGKLTFFFVVTPTHQCVGTVTGTTLPYPATYKRSGKFLIIDVPIPPDVDYPLPSQVGSLETELLHFVKATKTVHGKTVASIASVGCQGSKRPYSTTFTATLPSAGPAKEVDTVSGSAPC
jgi:hypothetical protein